MRKGIFRRILVIYGLILIVSVLFIEFYVTKVVEQSTIDRLKEDLTARATLIMRLVDFREARSLDPLCGELKKEIGDRITILGADGMVLGDSDYPSEHMENHRGRLEVQQALLEGVGWSIRFSDTLKEDLLYVAKRVPPETNPVGFVRLAIPLTEVQHEINGLRLRIVLAVVFVLLTTGTLIMWQAGKIRDFVLQITEYSRDLAKGVFGKRLLLRDSGELGEIAGNLNAMAEELSVFVERSLEETDRMNATLRNIPDALLILDSEGKIQISNETAKGYFVASDAPLKGKSFIEVVRASEFISLIEEVKRNKIAGFAEFRIEYPKERTLAVRVSPLVHKEGAVTGFVALFHDITLIRRLEDARKDFVANVSHEIKTPVTAIHGFAEALIDGALEDRENAMRFLGIIRTHSERINRLVDDLLTLSKIELGAMKIEKTDVDVSPIMDAVIDVVRGRAESGGLSLTKSLEPGSSVIRANRDWTTQILLNLVDNAIKFTNTGGVVIGFGRRGEKPFLFVKDTGIGIPRKYIPRLGERFFRVDPSRSRDLGGTGLGLAIVKHLVIALGWDMRIESAEGLGTEVRINVTS